MAHASLSGRRLPRLWDVPIGLGVVALVGMIPGAVLRPRIDTIDDAARATTHPVRHTKRIDARSFINPPQAVEPVRSGALHGTVVDEQGHGVEGVALQIVGMEREPAGVLLAVGELGVLRGPIPPIPRDPDTLDRPQLQPIHAISSSTSSTDGTFHLDLAPPGRVRVVARHPKFEEAMSDPIVLAPDEDKSIAIVLHPKALAVEREHRSPLDLHVVDDRGYPVVGAEITTIFRDQAPSSRMTSFTNGRGEATVQDAQGVALRMQVRAKGHAPKTIDVDANGEGTASTVEVELAVAEVLAGSVRSRRRGIPVPFASISIYTAFGVRTAVADKDGNFSVSDLAPTALRLNIRGKGYAGAWQDVDVEATGGDRPTSIDPIELEDEAIILGRVVDARGRSVPGVQIAEGYVPTAPSEGEIPRIIVLTDRTGSFRLGGVSEGIVTIEAYDARKGRAQSEGIRALYGEETRGVLLTLADP